MAQADIAIATGALIADLFGSAGVGSAAAFAVRLCFGRADNLERADQVLSKHRQRLIELRDIRLARLAYSPGG